jgi:hypothetical protein
MTTGLTVDNIIQSKVGSFESTSGTATLDAGTTAGNTVCIIAAIRGDGPDTGNSWTIALPTGFTQAEGQGGTFQNYGAIYAFIKPSASADETAWTLAVTGSGAQLVEWVAFEMTNIDCDWTDKIYLHAINTGAISAAATRSTGSTSVSETMSGLAVAAFWAVSPDTTVPTFTNYTNDFFEVASTSASNSPRACALSVVAKQQRVLQTVECTATMSPDALPTAFVLVFTGLDSQHATNVNACFGAEVGTAQSITAGGGGGLSSGTPIWDGVAGSPAVVTNSPRSGNYCLELSSVASAENLTWLRSDLPVGNLGVAAAPVPVAVERFHVYFPTALPVVDVDLASVEVGSLANGLVIRFVAASSKIGVKIGSGTEVLSDAVVVANKWIGIDYFYDPRTTTHTCAWQVDYDATPGDATEPVAQSPASASGMTAGSVTVIRKGWTGTTITATVRYDDIVFTRFRKAYPIGDVRIVPLKVDPAGTPAVKSDLGGAGTESNFKVFSNNGTMATWSATGTRTALDDIPPTIGGSSDGLAQVAVSMTDYVEVPMETYALAPNFVAVGGRWYWWGWAASANPANIRFKAGDGVTDFFSVGSGTDNGFDDTSQQCVACMHNATSNQNVAYQLTQAKLDALVATFGRSGDANPDCGVHAVLFELVLKPAVVVGVLESEGGAFKVYSRMDGLSGAVVSYLVTTPAGVRGATFYWTINGVDGSQYVGPNTTWEKNVGAVDLSAVTYVALASDPT